MNRELVFHGTGLPLTNATKKVGGCILHQLIAPCKVHCKNPILQVTKAKMFVENPHQEKHKHHNIQLLNWHDPCMFTASCICSCHIRNIPDHHASQPTWDSKNKQGSRNNPFFPPHTPFDWTSCEAWWCFMDIIGLSQNYYTVWHRLE